MAGNKEVVVKLKADINDYIKKMEKAGLETDGLKKALKEAEDGTKSLGGQKKSLMELYAATELLSKGFGVVKDAASAVYDIAKEYNNTKKVAEQLFKTNDAGLDELTKKATVTSAKWDSEVNEVLKSANVLSKQFGIEGTAALDLINKGFEAGADINGDYLEQLKEYPTQMKLVGLDAEQTIAIITQSVQSGVFSDKGLDSLKEAGLSLREMTQPTMDALKAIGMSGDLIQQQITDGTKTTFQAIQEISDKIAELPPQSKEVGAIFADVFKGAGEDAGDFIFQLGKIDTSLDNLGTSSNEMLSAQQELNEAWAEFKIFIAQSAEGLSSFVGFAADLLKTITPVDTELKKVTEQAIKQRAEFDMLKFTYLNLKEQVNLTAGEQRLFKETIEDLQRLYPNYLKNVDLEKDSYDKVKKALKEANEELENNIVIKMKEAETTEIYERNIALQLEEQELLKKKALITKSYSELLEKHNITEKQATELLHSHSLASDIRLASMNDEEKAQYYLGLRIALISDAYQNNNAKIAENVAMQKENTEEIAAVDEKYKALITTQKKAADTVTELSNNWPAPIPPKFTPELDEVENDLDDIKEMIITKAKEINEEMPPPPEFVGIGSEQYKIDLAKSSADRIAEINEEARTADFDAIDFQRDYLIQQNEEDLQMFANLKESQGELTAEQLNAQKAMQEKHDKGMAKLDQARMKQSLSLTTNNLAAIASQFEGFGMAAKRMAQAQAVIDTYAGATAAYKSAAGIPLVGWIMAPIAAAAAVGAGLANVAAIEKQKFAKGTVLSGQTHAQGGIQMYSSSGKYYGEAEDGEPVLTAGVSKNPQLLAAASAINIAGGGKPLIPYTPMASVVRKMKDGGVMTSVKPTAGVESSNNRTNELLAIIAAKETNVNIDCNVDMIEFTREISDNSLALRSQNEQLEGLR